MANCIDVRCKKCQTILDSVWVEELDKKLEVFIDINEESCQCLENMGEYRCNNGYLDGYDEARSEWCA